MKDSRCRKCHRLVSLRMGRIRCVERASVAITHVALLIEESHRGREPCHDTRIEVRTESSPLTTRRPLAEFLSFTAYVGCLQQSVAGQAIAHNISADSQ